ncbi:MAG: type IX secretion system sortase PorU [Cyclobacteriaceae bacterium]
MINKIVLASILTIVCTFSDVLAITYEPNSVLASGTWYKLAVVQLEDEINASGTILKLDYAYLQNKLGIDPSSVDPRNIKIYGGALGSALPQSYSAYTTDDLEELPVHFEGGADSIFNSSDYMLFYASFASNWSVDMTDTSYIYELNPYTDSSFYYVTIDESSQRKTPSNNINGTGATQTITSFDEHYHYEKEQTIIADATGRNLLGRSFNKNIIGNISLPEINNVDTSQSSVIKYSVANKYFREEPVRCELYFNNSILTDFTIDIAQFPYYNVYKVRESEFTFSSTRILEGQTNRIGVKNLNNSKNDRVLLDWFELFLSRDLTISNNYLPFRSKSSLESASLFQLSGITSDYLIWDVTDPLEVKNQLYDLPSQNFTTTSLSKIKEFIAFDKTQITRTPLFLNEISNQNLHSLSPTELIIITHPNFRDEANELASYRASEYGISTQVVDVFDIYNEFSAGRQDPTAIRNFVRMLFDKGPSTLKYLLLFGDGSYDYRHAVKPYAFGSYIPSYQARNWINNIESFQSDDYYALLEDGEGEWKVNATSYNLDISVGRIPVRNTTDATIIVNKLKRYDNPALTKGSWKTKSVIMADDGHGDLFVRQGESSSSIATDSSRINFVTEKIYMDAYEQISASSGNAVTVPQMEEDVINTVNDGALLITYLGHGSTTKLTSEKITSPTDIEADWLNKNKLPIVVIGSCSFGKFDHPYHQNSGVDAVLFSENEGGGIAIISPTRFVFANANGRMVDNFFESTTSLLAQNRHATLGDIYKSAKNNTYTEQGFGSNQFNNRNVALMGDPSMRINIPKYDAVIDSINGNVFNASANDTLSSLEVVEINGSIKDNENIVSNFNGTVTVEIMDRKSTYTTLGSTLGSSQQNSNDTEYNYKSDYKVREKSFFKGAFSVVDGKFTVSIVMPKYLSTLKNGEFGKISLHAFSTDSLLDASGAYTNIGYEYTPSTNCTTNCDVTPPEITILFADSSRIENNTVMKNASFSLLISDSSGISTSSEAIGRDILVEIRNVSSNDILAQYSVNELFSYNLNSSTVGTVTGLNLQDKISLDAGNYSLRVIAWDVYDNVRYETINFSIENTFKATANPNPVDFTFDAFEFNLSYDFVDEATETIVEIVNQSGNVVKTMTKSTEGIPDEDINIYWNGTSDGGEKVAPGIYIYRITVTSLTSEKKAKNVKRLVIAQ